MTSISRSNPSEIGFLPSATQPLEDRENKADREHEADRENEIDKKDWRQVSLSAAPNLLRKQLRQEMQHCRELTLALFAGMDYETFCQQAHPDFSPVGWHLGHIAYTESLWLLEHTAGQSPQFPQYRRLFAADGLPKTERVQLPTFAEVCFYLEQVRSQVFSYLEIASLDQQERLWRWLLQHETQHAETITLVLEMLRSQRSRVRGQMSGSKLLFGLSDRAIGSNLSSSLPLASPAPTSFPSPSLSEMVCVPAGEFEYGNNAIAALDNEQPPQRIFLDTYWIDLTPVTQEQYRAFMQADGYQNSHWWSAAGWQWLQTAGVTQPLYWVEEPAWNQHPVCGVSWYEADAYARFVGKRLPTELEWEKAASWNAIAQQRQPYPWGTEEPTENCCNHGHRVGSTTPVGSYPAGASPFGCHDMLGNVWEWTASWFEEYPGFAAYPYRGYSQAYFDGQHRVLRGGSWATFPWGLRCSFRNWYHPHMREMLAGFRCAMDQQG